MAAEESVAKRARLEPSAPQRTRAFPHVEGNYATHVFITVTPSAEAQTIVEDVISEAKQAIPKLQLGVEDHIDSPSAGPKEHHISLSHVVPIRFRDKDSLIAGLKSALAKTKSFEVALTQLEVLVNEQRTRSFLALSVSQGREQVCKAIARVNRVFLQHGLPQYHKDPRPHVSVAWAPGDEEQAMQEQAARLAGTEEGIAGRTATWRQQVHEIQCKIGKQVIKVWKA